MTDDKSVGHRIVENAERLKQQQHESRQVALDQYTIDELIENLKSRSLSHDQALELESMLISIPDKEEK